MTTAITCQEPSGANPRLVATQMLEAKVVRRMLAITLVLEG